MTLWFDAKTFRLTPLPPVIALLEDGEATRRELVIAGSARFGLSERKVDEMLSLQKAFLRESQKGHEKVFRIEMEHLGGAEWGALLMKRADDAPDRVAA
jgi:hypothetical protein